MAIKILGERDPEAYLIIMGVDSSSQGIAWTVLEGDALIDQGKVNLTKHKSMEHRLKAIALEFPKILQKYEPDIVVVEKSIFVKNPATARTLSYIVGSVMTLSLLEGCRAHDVEPATWKAWFGYRNLRREFVTAVKEALGKDAKKFCDTLRKSQTWNVIKDNYPEAEGTLANSDHDIADAWGIALWGCHTFHGELTLDTSNAVDKSELESLGLNL